MRMIRGGMDATVARLVLRHSQENLKQPTFISYVSEEKVLLKI